MFAPIFSSALCHLFSDGPGHRALVSSFRETVPQPNFSQQQEAFHRVQPNCSFDQTHTITLANITFSHVFRFMLHPCVSLLAESQAGVGGREASTLRGTAAASPSQCYPLTKPLAS